MKISKKLRIRAHECIFNVLGFYGIIPPLFGTLPSGVRLALLRTAMVIVCSAAHPSTADELQGVNFSSWLRFYCKDAVLLHKNDTFMYWLNLLRETDPQFYYKLTIWPA